MTLFWTFGDWAALCAVLALFGPIGQFLWNTVFADVRYWDDQSQGEQIPPLFWTGLAAFLFVPIWLLYGMPGLDLWSAP